MRDALPWNRYQDLLYHHPKLDFYVDVSRMRFDSGQMEAFKPRFDKAFRDMAALEAGAVANPD